MNKFLFTVAGLLLAINVSAEPYKVECASMFKACSRVVNENIGTKFSEKYPATDWKIVVPIVRVFRMGNGSLQSYLDVAVVPIATDVNAPKPKVFFVSSMRGDEIRAVGNPDLNGEMFEDARFNKAGFILMEMMAKEAMKKMMQACQDTVDCTLYKAP